MDHRFPLRRRSRNALSLLLGLMALLVSCERSTETPFSPLPDHPLTAGGAARAVVAGQNAHFYINAFQDDWSLFMGDRVSASFTAATEVAFIYTSAGDANLGLAYAQTRETATQAAADALQNVAGNWACASQAILTHAIRRCAKGAAVAYYMRLPDGSPSGDGYGTRGSMSALRDGSISSLSTLDGTATYTSWADVTNTIRAIVDLESANQSAPYVSVNAPDYDRTLNPGDHPDHYATADAVNAARSQRSWNLSWYVDNSTQNQPQNLTQQAHDIKQSAFYAYDSVMGAAGYGYGRYEADTQAWLWRTYYRSTSVTPPSTPVLQTQAISTTRVDLTWTIPSADATAVEVQRAPDNAGVAGTYALVATLGATATTYSNTGLSASTRYWYRVRISSASGASTYSNESAVTTLAALAAPTNFVATAASSSRIDLSWNGVANATGYYLERAPDNSGAAGTWAALATLASGVTTYADQGGLAAGTRYWYRVRSLMGTDTSAFTAAVSATTLNTRPDAPTALTAAAVSPTQINLAWADNSNNESSFYVERAPNNNGVPGTFARIATVAANSTTYSNTGLAASTRYWYRVRAVNSLGTSAYTNQANATTLAQPVGHTDFFLHAHPDDWQLFMGNEASLSYSNSNTTKLVFVTASAGDANLGTSYWQTRELGAQAVLDTLLGSAGTWSCTSQTVNTHPLRRCARGKVVGYFMRLPDGGPSGDGYGGRGSMTLLQSGSIGSLRAMDGSTTYASWTDLVNTVRGIVDLESNNQSAPYVEVSLPDYDRTLNPGDHPDHFAVADMVQDAAGTRSWNQTMFVDYQTQNMPINLTQAQHDVEQRLFYAYDNVVGGAGYGYSQYEAPYQAWLWRSYSRRVVVR